MYVHRVFCFCLVSLCAIVFVCTLYIYVFHMIDTLSTVQYSQYIHKQSQRPISNVCAKRHRYYSFLLVSVYKTSLSRNVSTQLRNHSNQWCEVWKWQSWTVHFDNLKMLNQQMKEGKRTEKVLKVENALMQLGCKSSRKKWLLYA